MFEQIETLFKKRNILSHKNQEITVAKVPDQGAGIELAKEILYQAVDRRTVLYLSGGSLKFLYEILTHEERIRSGAVGLIDERFGSPFHKNSNQLMIRDTGFTRYLEILNIPFYPVLQGKTREETAEDYDQKIRELNSVYPQSIGLLGIGPDGHTSGVPALSSKVKVQNSKLYDNHTLVSEYNDMSGKYGERVTMTFLGLSMLDLLIVPVFGSSKQNALSQMFEEGLEKEIPARFYKRPDVARKTLLITDQTV